MRKNSHIASRIITCFAAATVIIAMSVITAFAANTVTVNSKEFNEGDTVTFTVKLKADKNCSGINAEIKYDSNSLELDKSSINVPNLGQTIANSEKTGSIKFAAIDAAKGFDFKEEKLLISASFTVKEKASDNEIKIAVSEMYDTDLKDMTSSDYSINEQIEKGKYDGEIVNPVDGMDAIKQDSATADTASVVNDNNTNNSNPFMIWAIVGVAAAAVVLVVVAIVYKKKKQKQADSVSD
ncbi:MAG: cohesin domain-containing protein [Ruminococcus sp.]|nr:cohesin domain-containing protein [Ruminococcus sp.]MDY2855540.1 cohesin domain-containing protein [Oscillospiraceae bacterium]